MEKLLITAMHEEGPGSESVNHKCVHVAPEKTANVMGAASWISFGNGREISMVMPSSVQIVQE